MMRVRVLAIAAVLAMALCGVVYTVSYPQQPPQHTLHELVYIQGETQAVGDGVMYPWVRIDSMNRPSAIGVTFTESILTNLPDTDTEYLARLPEVVPHAPFNHIALDWVPKGHFPEQFYGVPHFDVHFYMITPQARSLITGLRDDEARVNKLPAAQFLPQGYVPAKPGVALMGLHWVRPDFPEFHGQPFTASLIYGTYNGQVTFIEPMITRAYLLTHPSVNRAIDQPKAVQTSGSDPPRFTTAYDA
ncbi:MAG TPA: DUF5602 domain-containing protein, partial [Armatimonadota bacterium]|nr:DUF5602 domain-containing protein [Armatimonadota bacterium]